MNQRLTNNLPVWLLWCIWLLPTCAAGQRISLGDVPQTLCAGATVPVSFTVNEPFQAGNVFRIELVDAFDNVLVTNADNVLPSGSFVRLPPGLPPNPALYRVHIRASKPTVYSNDAVLTVNTTPTATLQGPPTADVSISPGEPLRAGITLTGGGPFTLSFTDGSTRTLDDVSQTDVLFYPDKSKTYQLATVSNQCGSGRAGGSVSATVRAAGLLVTRLSTTEPCAGKPLDIFFSTDRVLPGNTAYKVDFQGVAPNNAAYTVTALGNVSPLRVVVPTNVATGGQYQVRLYSETANVSAYYRNSYGDVATPVVLRRPPSIRLSGGTSVGYGQAAAITATVTGLSTGAVTLSDGTAIALSALNSDGDRPLLVRPAQTTTYTVRGVSSSCGVYGPEAGSSSATVTVQPGYRIDSLSSLSVCAGQPVRVYFTTNEPLSTDAGGYGFRGYNLFVNNLLGGGQLDFIVQNVVAGSLPNTGILTVTPRSLPTDYLTNAGYGPTGTLLAGSFFCQISRHGRVGNAYEKPLAVADKPQLLAQNGAFSVNRPQTVPFPAQLASNTYLTDVQLTDGTRMTIRSSIDVGQKSRTVSLEVLAGQSGTFSVASVQNSCGVGVAQGSVSVSVRSDTAALLMRPIPDLLCAGSPVSVAFAAAGVIGAVANYRVEIMGDDGLFAGNYLASGTASPIAVTIPAGFSLYNRIQLRVVSVPAAGTVAYQSNARAFTYLDAAALVRLSVAGSGGTETVIRPGETASLRLVSGGNVPVSILLSDGQTVAFNGVGADFGVKPGQTTTYTIRSVRTSCGVAAGVGTVTVRVQPFSLQPLLPKRTFCDSDSLETHLLVQGELPPQATHAIQVLRDGNVVQTLPARLADNRLTSSPPASLSAATPYTVRVLTTVGSDQFYSLPTATTFRVYQKPRLLLTPPNNQSAVILEASQASLTVQLTNPADPTATLLNSRYNYRINEQPYTAIDNVPADVSIFATSITPASYSISAVYDSYCGFGTATGAVRVSYKPGLRSIAVSKYQFCRGSDQGVVSYEIAGDFPADTRFAIFLTNALGVRTRVGESTKQIDRLVFPIDSSLASGTYQVSVTLPPGLPAYDAFPTVTIGDRPTVVIAGGNVVQYGDQTVSVGIRVLSGVLPVSVTLTNGIVQTLFAPDNLLTFSPQQSTTYQLAQVINSCGAGRASGVVSVTVLPPSANEIRVAAVGPQGGVTGICQSGSLQVSLALKGSFPTDNRFTIYLSDTTGQQYRPLLTRTVDATTLTADLPAEVLTGTGYRVRIGASNPNLLGAASGTFLTIRPGLVATLTGNASVLRGELTPLLITANNSGPWSVTLNNSIYGLETAIISTSPFRYQVRPDQTTTYTLVGVFNVQCGTGRASGQATLTTTNPLAISPALPVLARVLPNPTAGQVRVMGTLPAPQTVTIRLTDATGRVLQTHSPGLVSELAHDLDLSQYAAGVYLLTVEAADRRTIFKVVKE